MHATQIRLLYKFEARKIELNIPKTNIPSPFYFVLFIITRRKYGKLRFRIVAEAPRIDQWAKEGGLLRALLRVCVCQLAPSFLLLAFIPYLGSYHLANTGDVQSPRLTLLLTRAPSLIYKASQGNELGILRGINTLTDKKGKPVEGDG